MTDTRQQHLFEHKATPWEDAAADDWLIAKVVFNRPIEDAFSYRVPDALREMIQPGQRVRAPFGRGDRATTGFCVCVGADPGTSRRLKSIDSILDREPLLSQSMLELTGWIAEHYLCGWGQVLHSVVPASVRRRAGTRLITFLRPADGFNAAEAKLPRKQQAVMDALRRTGRPMRIDELTEAADCGTGPVQALRQKGALAARRERTTRFETDLAPVEPEADLALNTDQTAALNEILAALRSMQHHTILLHGVTGSGKTEVYIQAIREVVSYGRQTIVLVPEISLTPQTIRRFRARFRSVAVLHSHLSDAERHWHWQQIERGEVQVVVGARSAVFAPAPQLGLIVIDEEHETSFKQETTPRYHAREVARRRAEIDRVPLVLGSATPFLESWMRAAEGNDTLVSMPRRIKDRPLPSVDVVDVRTDPRISSGSAIGRRLFSAIQTTLDNDGQLILFQNLRGYSPVVWCRSCGDGVKCPGCDITLTWHRDRNIVLCHFCDYHTEPPKKCPYCGSSAVRFFGTGTQKLEQEVRSSFRDSRVLRMDSDSMRRPGSHDEALESFRCGEARILVGTQMIAKGLDFPNVTLVGVIDADTMLHQPDLRASERTFQLIAQVAGRTGRSDRGGRVLVQTSSPDEAAIVLAAKHDYVGFAQHELKFRRDQAAPPFACMARVILRAKREDVVQAAADDLADGLRQHADRITSPVRLLGPAPAPVARLRGHFRYHLQMTAPEVKQIHQLWKSTIADMQPPAGVELVVDVDPLNMR